MEQTLAEYWIDQGVQKGEQAGILKAKRDAVLRLISGKFGAPSEEVARRVQSLQDTEALDRLFDQAIQAASTADLDW